MKLSYRKDIDGLRAVAVLSVIFFHSGFGFFPGGYVGVDIFFVISGFLITTILYKEIEAGDFSLARFYEKRIRRIFPALFSVIVFSLLFGAIFYAPEDLDKLAKSVRYTVIFFSNYFFARETGYFETSAELEPLLHTWSLAVEEQYYIVFPAILLTLKKFVKSKLLLCLGFLFVLSFIVSLMSVIGSEESRFYVTEGRVWELLIGSFLALNLFPVTHNLIIKNTLSILGLILISWAVLFFDKETIFPGYLALVPTTGAALVIYSGMGGHSGKLYVAEFLGSKLMVYIGLVSYSLYLWHWPLIVFAEHLLIRPLSIDESLLLLVLMGVISFFSWKYIEQPFRKNTDLNNQKKVFITTVSVMVALFIVCLVIKATDGLAMRSSKPVDIEWEKWGQCNDSYKTSVVGGDECQLGQTGVAPNFMLWGDSHARAIAPGVSLSAESFEQAGVIASINGCPPLLGLGSQKVEECFLFNDKVLEYIKSHPDVKVIILSARWATYIEGGLYEVNANNLPLLSGAPINDKSLYSNNTAIMNRALQRTVEKLRDLDRKVVLMNQVPDVGHNVESISFIAEIRNRNVNELIAPSLESYINHNKPVKRLFDKLQNSIEIVEPYKLLCDDKKCDVQRGTSLLYKDDNHLSSYGAKKISAIFAPVFQPLVESK